MKKLLPLIILVSVISCKKEKHENDNGSSNQNFVMSPYPLTIGNSWKYHCVSRTVDDSTGAVIFADTIDSYWTVIGDTMINGVVSQKVERLDTNYDGTTSIGYTYYANKADGFYGMAVDNYGSIFVLSPFTNETIESRYQGVFAMGMDSLFIPDTPLWFLKFPIQLNDSWHTRRYGTGEYFHSRKYMGYESVFTNAGTFNCIKVHGYWESDGVPDTTRTVFQYFCDKGIIKETQINYLNFGFPATMTQTTVLVAKNF
jgi:hypothetical protein